VNSLTAQQVKRLPWFFALEISVCLRVCVCVRERERERGWVVVYVCFYVRELVPFIKFNTGLTDMLY
jgi:hypothetical protein